MIGWLRPLEISLDFEDQVYELGETIDMKVSLLGNRDVRLIRGRAELLCEVRYTELDTVKVPARSGFLNVSDSRPLFFHVTKHVVKKNRKRYIRGNCLFLSDTDIRAGETREYDARLEIQPRRPPHALDGILAWSIQTTVRLASGRDIRCSRSVRVRIA